MRTDTDITKLRALTGLIERYQAAGDAAWKAKAYNSEPRKLVINTSSYTINVPLDEYPELLSIFNNLVEYIQDVTEVKVAAVKKEIKEVLKI